MMMMENASIGMEVELRDHRIESVTVAVLVMVTAPMTMVIAGITMAVAAMMMEIAVIMVVMIAVEVKYDPNIFLECWSSAGFVCKEASRLL